MIISFGMEVECDLIILVGEAFHDLQHWGVSLQIVLLMDGPFVILLLDIVDCHYHLHGKGLVSSSFDRNIAFSSFSECTLF